MTDLFVTAFKQLVHVNLNLAFLICLAWLLLAGKRGARTTTFVWSVLLIRFLCELLLCPEIPELPVLDFSEEGSLALGVGLGLAARTISLALGLGPQLISAGDLAVLSVGEAAAACLGALALAVVSVRLIIRLFRLGKETGTGGDIEWSEQTSVPHVRGWLRPGIVVPLGLKDHLSPREMEALLCHERAHIKRGDHRLFAIFYLLRSFTIVVWPLAIILDGLEQAVERLCDRVAARQVGALETARALLKTAEYQSRAVGEPPLACPSFGKHPIHARIGSLKSNGHGESLLVAILSMFLIAAVIL